MTPLTIVEIQPILHLLHRNRILLCSVLQDELFKVQERPFVRDFLSDLNECLPGVLRCELRAVGTLAVLDEVLDFEDLFEDRVGQDLFLTGQ